MNFRVSKGIGIDDFGQNSRKVSDFYDVHTGAGGGFFKFVVKYVKIVDIQIKIAEGEIQKIWILVDR